MARAVFLDRDGTVIVDRAYLDNVEGVQLLPRAGEALSLLATHGFLLVVVTNQSGIGRGYFSAQTVEAQHRRLEELLAAFGVRLAGVAVCPHAPWEECDCRKPAPGLIARAAARLQIDLSRSYVIGDKVGDVAAGRAAGCMTVRVGEPCPDADAAVPDLWQAAQWVLAREAAVAVTGGRPQHG